MSHRCFVEINSAMSWDVAKRTCQKRDSHLASILSKEENDAINVTFDRTDYWLGGIYNSENSEYIWVDGELLLQLFCFLLIYCDNYVLFLE